MLLINIISSRQLSQLREAVSFLRVTHAGFPIVQAISELRRRACSRLPDVLGDHSIAAHPIRHGAGIQGGKARPWHRSCVSSVPGLSGGARCGVMRSEPSSVRWLMTKADLIHAMAERTGLSHPEAAVVVESIVAVLEEALQRGEAAHIVDFGRFTVRQKQARVGRHLRTGEPITIRPWKVVTFKSSGILRALVNRGEV
jgi:integration host factor subunit alpha